MRAVSQKIPQPLTTKINLKISHLKFTLNLPGANELIPRQFQPQASVTKFSSKITYLEFHSNLPGANELQTGPTAFYYP